MGRSETTNEKSEWTSRNLQRLLAAMKNSIAKKDRGFSYTKGLKEMHWENVAFPPFSPEACKEKWQTMLAKMRKVRTLTELITEAEQAISTPAKNFKIHPQLPKRPCPPNIIFSQEKYATFKEKHSEMTSARLLSLLSKEYKKLPAKKKDHYLKKYELALKEYERQMLEFRELYLKHPSSKQKSHKKKRKRSSDTDLDTEDEDSLPPRPPASGYALFCQEQFASMAESPKKGYVSVWAKRWRDLTDSRRQEYSNLCNNLKEEYQSKLQEFLMTRDEDEQKQILKKLGIKSSEMQNIKRRKYVQKFRGEPKMPLLNGCAIFRKDQMEILKVQYPKSSERFSQASKIWNELSNAQKKVYTEKVKSNFRKYSMELQKWFETLTPKEQDSYQTLHPKKTKYLEQINNKMKTLHRPSDSEDEDIEDSSSNDEEYFLDYDEDEESEEEGDIMFTIY
ncbi:uncharacterized protein V6R79_023426 [Siganus canaliculatus]